MYDRRVAFPLVCALRCTLALAVLGGCSSGSPGGGAGSGDPASDAGVSMDAGRGGAVDSGAPTPVLMTDDGGVVAPETWTWVPIAGTRCANGSPTGMGINIHPGATSVTIYLEGGGACYDGTTCWQSTTALNINGGYGQDQFNDDITLQYGFLVRHSTLDVFADSTLVYIPYCTGDLHLGNAETMYLVDGVSQPTYHYGAHNVDLDVAVIGQLYPQLTRVFLSGSSAGGYGSLGNQDAVTRALETRVDVIDDSGPPVNLAYGGSTSLPASWGARLPPGCSTCDSGPGLYAYSRATYPSTRFGLLTYTTDVVLPTFYGVSATVFASALSDVEARIAPDPNARYFAVQSAGHVVLAGTVDVLANDAMPMWLGAMISDDPSWASETR